MPDQLTDEVVDGLIADIAPKDGSFEVTRLSDPESLCTVKSWCPTGCLPLDIALGGGFPYGRITEIYGDNSTGKSLMAAQAVAEAQHEGAVAVFIDVESAVSTPLMAEIDVDVNKLIHLTPDTIDQLHKSIQAAVQSKTSKLGADYPMVVVWDSIASSTTLTEMDTIAKDGLDKKQYAQGAIQISAMLRSGLPRMFARNNVCAIFINQVRENVGVTFGDDITTYGGKAVGFYASIRIELSSSSMIKEGKRKKVGIWVRIKVTKNKVAPPYRELKVPIYFGHGMEEAEATLEILKDEDIVEVRGGWSTVQLGGEDHKFQGKTQWCESDGLFDSHYDEIAGLLEKVYNG